MVSVFIQKNLLCPAGLFIFKYVHEKIMQTRRLGAYEASYVFLSAFAGLN